MTQCCMCGAVRVDLSEHVCVAQSRRCVECERLKAENIADRQHYVSETVLLTDKVKELEAVILTLHRAVPLVETQLRLRVEELEAERDRLTARWEQVAHRLKSWSDLNDAERASNKVPTFLNPHTVLTWLGSDTEGT